MPPSHLHLISPLRLEAFASFQHPPKDGFLGEASKGFYSPLVRFLQLLISGVLAVEIGDLGSGHEG
jgi:hypothetical protein